MKKTKNYKLKKSKIMKKLHKYIACVAIFVATAFMTTSTGACPKGWVGTNLITGNCGTIPICALNNEMLDVLIDAYVSACEAAVVIGPK
ncbi:MAG: hypothetical protein LBH22_03755 [Bacteroidales bacterium]|jgi:hypothetical protein|nr:hypothetical protein [Bacteroidales bacterium]